jgi:hypothetical protein
MTQWQAAPARRRALANYLRPVLIAASWLGLVILATGFFFAPRGAEVQPTMDDAVGFGCSTAIAGAAAAIAAFGICGRRRWAVEMLLLVLLMSAIAALFVIYVLWFDPTLARWQMDQWAFLRLQQGAGHWAVQLAGYHGPLGAAVGIALGVLAGLLIKLGRQRPRLATVMAVAMLLALASDFGRVFAFHLVTWVGLILRYFVVPWSISDDQISITGMIFGAVAGCVVAGLAIYATRPKPAQAKTATDAARSGRAIP